MCGMYTLLPRKPGGPHTAPRTPRAPGRVLHGLIQTTRTHTGTGTQAHELDRLPPCLCLSLFLFPFLSPSFRRWESLLVVGFLLLTVRHESIWPQASGTVAATGASQELMRLVSLVPSIGQRAPCSQGAGGVVVIWPVLQRGATSMPRCLSFAPSPSLLPLSRSFDE